MENKKKIIAVFFLFFTNSYAQNIHKDFHFENSENSEKPIIIDDLTFLNLDFKKEIAYSKLKNWTKYEDGSQAIEVKDTVINKFYFYKKYEVGGFKNIVIYQKSKTKFAHYIYFYQLFFTSKNEFLNLSRIGLRTEDKFMQNLNSLLFNDYYFLWTIVDKNILSNPSFFKFNSDKILKYEDFDCIENIFCSSYKADFNNIPERNINKIIFDSSFFKTVKNLIPLKYCSPVLNTKILSSIGNSDFELEENYFIESKRIDNDKKIFFTLNKYKKNESYHDVYEIVYHIINSKNEVIKSEQISLIYSDNKGMSYLNWGKIISDSNKLKIITGCKGCETKSTIISLTY